METVRCSGNRGDVNRRRISTIGTIFRIDISRRDVSGVRSDIEGLDASSSSSCNSLVRRKKRKKWGKNMKDIR